MEESNNQTNKKSYSELMKLNTFDERLSYLQTYDNNPANQNRTLMNKFYKSKAWLNVRDYVIKRDLGCDLGIQNEFVTGSIIVHHINPISEYNLLAFDECLIDPENLITVSYDTHNKIHYCTFDKVSKLDDRKPGDTKLW